MLPVLVVSTVLVLGVWIFAVAGLDVRAWLRQPSWWVRGWVWIVGGEKVRRGIRDDGRGKLLESRRRGGKVYRGLTGVWRIRISCETCGEVAMEM